ncbi:hypothetical protein HY837_01850 [archaeon]|nr:hypothetical protein [archaeon]
MTGNSLLLKLVGDVPAFRIVDFLIENKGLDFSKKEIIEGAEISKATLFNYWEEVEDTEIVKPTRKFGKTTLFTLNTSNPIVKRLLDLELEIIRHSMDKKAERKIAVLAS